METLLTRMERFYLNVENGNGFVRDDEGAEFVDVAAARAAAIRAGAEIIADELKDGCHVVRLTMMVEFSDHSQAFNIPMSASIDG